MASDTKARVHDIISGIAYGLTHCADAATIAKPIAVKDSASSEFVLGFLYSNGKVACPTKLVFNAVGNAHGCTIGLRGKEWTKQAVDWVERNKPCSAFDLPDVVDIIGKVPLDEESCALIADGLESCVNASDATFSLVECHSLFSSREACLVRFPLGEHLASWIVEKDLANA